MAREIPREALEAAARAWFPDTYESVLRLHDHGKGPVGLLEKHA